MDDGAARNERLPAGWLIYDCIMVLWFDGVIWILRPVFPAKAGIQEFPIYHC
jgi:hypothetical protein